VQCADFLKHNDVKCAGSLVVQLASWPHERKQFIYTFSTRDRTVKDYFPRGRSETR
jgi:hypothetical protein